MARYKIWDKQEDIYTPSGAHFTAAEWLAKYPWADIPGVEMIITAGVINGGAAMELNATKEHYAHMGADFSDCTSSADVLTVIEAFEDNPPSSENAGPEERIAAALEYQNLLSLPDVQ